MTKEEVLEIVRRNTLDIMPDVSPSEITTDKALVDLGANSLDRTDITLQSMEELGVKISPMELGKVANLQDLVDLFHKYKNV